MPQGGACSDDLVAPLAVCRDDLPIRSRGDLGDVCRERCLSIEYDPSLLVSSGDEGVTLDIALGEVAMLSTVEEDNVASIVL